MKKIRKELIEWGLFFGVLGVLYFTGLHTDVAGGMQRIILKTGIFNVSDNEKIEPSKKEKADLGISLVSLDGKRLDLQSLEGKTIFINFWATWCPPCIAEMPGINDLYQDTKSENIVFIMISEDRETEKARKFMASKEYDFPVYFRTGPLPAQYQGRSIPRTYVISSEGFLAAKIDGLTNYDTKKFREFLKGL